MPLLDHFHPPLSAQRRWESFHSSWATRIADELTQHWLPPDYIAEEYAHFGPSVEIGGQSKPSVQQSPLRRRPSDGMFPGVFPETFEVRVLATDTGPRLVATIELVSPGNKDRPIERKAFATKCASYLYQGISVIIIDIVTSRRANLHNEILSLMESSDALLMPAETGLYAVAYQPLRRGSEDVIEVWRSPLVLGMALPTLPLGLRADLVIPVDFEAAYAEACLRKRLTGS